MTDIVYDNVTNREVQLNDLVTNREVQPQDNPVLQGNFAPVDVENRPGL